MSTVHFLNVNPGDCSIIQHGTGNVSVIDICGGYRGGDTLAKLVAKQSGNFRYADHPTNPISYLKALGITSIWRFIATHPDMDHLDGLDKLASEFAINNFWDSGFRRPKPPFNGGPYKEADWDRYVNIRDDKEPTNVQKVLAGARFAHANEPPSGGSGLDGLHIVAPTADLVNLAIDTDDPNDASYVIVYSSPGGRIIFTGDAHDDTFEYILKHHEAKVKNCSILIAPHHGRHSDRKFEFLDVINPALTLFGYAPSEHLAYGAWRSRNLPRLTSNQSGDVVLECLDGRIDVYIENASCPDIGTLTNAQGYSHYGHITRP